MRRAMAKFVAALVGAALGAVVVWLVLGADLNEQTLGWTMIVSMFVAPVIGVAVAHGITVLEWGAAKLNLSRTAVLLWGGVLVPLGLVLLLGLPQMLRALAGNGADFAAILAISGGAIVPCFVACLTYVTLTTPREAPPAPGAPTQAPKPEEPSPFAQVVLEQPPTTQRVLELLTEPNHRIGQRHFMYCVQLWIRAAGIWFLVPFLAGAWFDLERDVMLTLALAGWLVLFWGAFCACANRLHDLGRGAVFAALAPAGAVAWSYMQGAPETGWFSTTTLVHWIIATNFGFGALTMLLLTRKGDPLPNQYGLTTQ